MRKKIKALLSDVAALEAKTNAAEQRIMERATARHGEASKRLDELRPSVTIVPESAKEYRALLLDRGHCAKVIGQSKKLLAMPA